MVGAKSYPAPCVSGTKLSSTDGDPLASKEATLYRKIVGALQYCVLTRPDIAHIVNHLCQFMYAPTTAHWTSTKCVTLPERFPGSWFIFQERQSSLIGIQ